MAAFTMELRNRKIYTPEEDSIISVASEEKPVPKRTCDTEFAKLVGPPSESLSFQSEVVKIHAGTPALTFSVHENIIKSTSSFFNAAFSSYWLEGTEREIHMPEALASMVNLYINWAYTKKLKLNVPKNLYEIDDMNAILVAAYIFAEQIQDNTFADNVMDILIAANKMKMDNECAYLDSDLVAAIYRHTSASSTLRKFVQEEYIWNGRAARLDDLARDMLPADFLFDLAVGLMIYRQPSKTRNPTKDNDTCSYHKHHQTGEACYKYKDDL